MGKESRQTRIYEITQLFRKYNAQSTSELYDKCTNSEWEKIIGMPTYQELLSAARTLYIKRELTEQRKSRWNFVMEKLQNYEPNPAEIQEVENLLFKNKISLLKFALDVHSILEMTHPKKNTIKLWGVPDSGKSLIANAIVKPFIVCYMNNHGAENEFFISNMLNKSIVLCEELYITTATGEDFKSILGGQPIDIAKKYDEKQLMARTPIIVTSNYAKFGRGHLPATDENALNIRCHVYQFLSPYKPSLYINWWNFYFCIKKHLF